MRFGATTIVRVALVCALVIGTSEGSRRALQSVVRKHDDLLTGEIDEYQV